MRTNNQASASIERVALVIGNSNYVKGQLRNPVSDALAMSEKLQNMGFQVISGHDLSWQQMRRKVKIFGRRLRQGGVGLFYFAGHGVQVRGQNYLIPVRAEIYNEEEVPEEALGLNYVLARMAAAHSQLNIVILDACRDNPYAPGQTAADGRGKHERSFRSGGAQGLAQVKAPRGTVIAFAGAVSRVAWKHLKEKNIKITAESSGASVANSKLIGKGDADFALMQNDIAFYAHRGTVMFRKPNNNLLGCMTLYPETIQIVARKDAGIRSVADLKGKRVSIGLIGSGTSENAKQILAAYGLKPSDLRVHQMKTSQAADYVKDGRLDAYFNTTAVGAAHIIDTFFLVPCMIVPIEGPEADALLKKHPFFTKDVVKPGIYKGSDAPVNTVAVMAMLTAGSHLEADLVYGIMKAIYSDLAQIKKAHAKLDSIKLDTALNGMCLPLHPGARRYFKEKGIL